MLGLFFYLLTLTTDTARQKINLKFSPRDACLLYHLL